MSESKNPLRPVYEEQLHSIFRLPVDETSAIDFELVSVTALKAPEGQESFSLIFRAPRNVPPAQGTYGLQHEKLGTFDFFLVPIKQDKDGIYFEAIFNRMLQ